MKIRAKFSWSRTSEQRKSEVTDYLQMAANRMMLSTPVDACIPWQGGKRNSKDQNMIYLEGNSKCDGYNKISYHQKVDNKGKGKALDIVPYVEGIGACYTAPGRSGIIGALMLEAWEELQEAGLIPENVYLHWGGLWSHRDPKTLGWDIVHFEQRSTPQIERV